MKKFFIIALIIVMILLNTNISVSEKTIKKALKNIADKYGFEIAMNVEKIYRKETANFKSEGFLKTFGAGMEAVVKNFPYGWISMTKIWSIKENKPLGIINMTDSGNRNVNFIKFPSVYAGMVSLAEYLKKYPAGRWYSTDEFLANKYEEELKNIKSKFVNEFLTV